MRKLSGDELVVVKRFAHGHYPQLKAQWEWLRDRGDRAGLVHVGSWGRGGYEMEMLSAYPSSDVYDVVRVIGAVLRRDVWRELPADTELWWGKHLAYIRARGGDVVRFEEEPIPDGLVAFETHGDPTPDNLMRRGEEPVLIDPLPWHVAQGVIPPLREVDVGKLWAGLKLGDRLHDAAVRVEFKADDLNWDVVRFEAYGAVLRRARRSGENAEWVHGWYADGKP